MPDDGQDGSDHDDGFDKASGLTPDFMSKLRAAGERASAKPDPWHQVATEQAKLREEMQELKGQLRSIQAGLDQIMQHLGRTTPKKSSKIAMKRKVPDLTTRRLVIIAHKYT